MNIEDLFSEVKENHKCFGCSIFDTPGEHCIIDSPSNAEILVVGGSYVRSKFGKISSLAYHEKQYIEKVISRYSLGKPHSVSYTAAVKCPSVQEKSMKTEDFKICRQYIEQTIRDVKPKIIITLGNLALKMVTGKSGIFNKRGTEFQVLIDGKEYKVIPTLSAGHVIAEPSLKFYFEADIRNILAKYLGGQLPLVSDYDYVDTIKGLKKYEWLYTTDLPLAVDVETTGFDFNRDIIQTISFTSKKGTLIIPFKHKDSPFANSEHLLIPFLEGVLGNTNNVKIFHNSSFDLKFFMKLGINTSNPMCTAAMAHLVNEDMQKKLINLVKLYIPERLENLKC